MERYEILSNLQIDSILSKYQIFKGAFPANLVPLMERDIDQGFIINIDKDGLPGSHWTALVIQKKKCTFFDPLGFECLNLQLLNKLKAQGFSNYKYSTNQLQQLENNNCGYFCIAFILSMIKTPSLTNFLSQFAKPNVTNNDICYDLIDKYIYLQHYKLFLIDPFIHTGWKSYVMNKIFFCLPSFPSFFNLNFKSVTRNKLCDLVLEE